MRKTFYGWWITLAVFCTFGLSVGIPYYNAPFFFDYYKNEFHWATHDVTLGFPLAALLTLWVGPVLIPRFSQRKLILAGTFLTFLAFLGFSRMTGDLTIYYALYFVYTMGYILSGPIPHQVIISHWFKRNRGTAMGLAYVGVGIFGAIGTQLVKVLTQDYGFRTALLVMGVMMFLAWPIAIFVLRDRPEEKGLYADGATTPPPHSNIESRSLAYLCSQPTFWLLLIGSICSIGAIGSINFHMKLVFHDQGFTEQSALNSVWSAAQFWILISSISGRLLIGKLADVFPMKYVMTATYFVVAGAIPLLLMVKPGDALMTYVFAIVFGFAMGADYMLIPLMAAKQFGVNSLARAMAVILPVNTIGQTWVPQGVSYIREHYGNYTAAMGVVLLVAAVGAIAIALLPKQGVEDAVPSPARETVRA
jgi:MFS family permease